MGLTKQYLAYKPVGNFNIIASGNCNAVFVTLNKADGRYVAVGAAENTVVWDVRLGQKAMEFRHEKDEVTALRPSPDLIHLAVGYATGTVRIYNLVNNALVFTLDVHRSAVNVLRYDGRGMQLVSGGQDTDLVISDMVAQVGTCRLTGHSGPITDTCFYEPSEDILISSSKDTHIKFWNIATKSCIKTLVDHRSNIWGIALFRQNEFLVTGCSDTNLNVYKITVQQDVDAAVDGGSQARLLDNEIDPDDVPSPIRCTLVGSIQRIGKGRTVNLLADPTGKVLACHGTDNTIELFVFCDEKESLQRLAKRMKKMSVDEQLQKDVTLSDEVKRLQTIKTGNKVKSIDLLIGAANELRVVATFADNFIKMYALNMTTKRDEAQLLKSLTQHGHHSEVRAVCFSSDGLAIASGSGNSLKLWNRESMTSLRTIENTGYILCCTFVPGDRHVLLGLKTGALLIVDVVVGEIIEEISAHQDELWSMCLLPDLKSCVTGGGDKTVKIWSFELVSDAGLDATNDAKVLSLLHKNTLKLDETVCCVKVSPNNKFIAVGLLDATVKIFFMDSFKFYLSLYGHKLPVMCLDISDDSAIIATGSADRNVKIWGMDFGDCHRSLFAHDDSVMALQFIPRSHMFWTCGKDGQIKQWDGDSFVKIVSVPGHIGEAYALSVDRSGHHLVTCGSDRVMRLFERTQEMIVLQDVQEEEREQIESRTLATGEDTSIPGLPNLKLASKKTVGSEKAAESILECLEVGKDFDADEDNNEIPPLMRAYGSTNSIDYLISVVTKIRSTDLEETLLLLPFSAVCEVLEKIPTIVERRKDETELICKVVLFLLRIHQKPIVGNHTLLPVLQNIMALLQTAVVEMRDMFGTNQRALQLLQREVEARDGIELFRDVTKAKKKKDKKLKKRHLTKRLHIQMA